MTAQPTETTAQGTYYDPAPASVDLVATVDRMLAALTLPDRPPDFQAARLAAAELLPLFRDEAERVSHSVSGPWYDPKRGAVYPVRDQVARLVQVWIDAAPAMQAQERRGLLFGAIGWLGAPFDGLFWDVVSLPYHRL